MVATLELSPQAIRQLVQLLLLPPLHSVSHFPKYLLLQGLHLRPYWYTGVVVVVVTALGRIGYGIDQIGDRITGIGGQWSRGGRRYDVAVRVGSGGRRGHRSGCGGRPSARRLSG